MVGRRRAKRGRKKPAAPGPCYFIRLPRELRDEIYSYLFCSTRFTFANRLHVDAPLPRRRIIPAAHGLALLRTCRQIHEEVGDSWIGEVLFNYVNPQTLLDKLSVLPRYFLSKIRHVRVRGDGVKVYDHSRRRPEVHGLCHVFSLLPGLHLDQPTVLAGSKTVVHPIDIYRQLRWGEGWKELRVVTRDGPSNPRRESFTSWISYELYWHMGLDAIKERERYFGLPSSMAVYGSTAPDIVGAVLDPRTRAQLEWDEKEPGGDVEANEIMVVVKRGAGASSAIGRTEYNHSILRGSLGVDTWAKMRRRSLGVFYEDGKEIDERDLVVRDKYVSVDDFKETGIPFC